MGKVKVTLTQEEREQLQALVKRGQTAARKIDHARGSFITV